MRTPRRRRLPAILAATISAVIAAAVLFATVFATAQSASAAPAPLRLTSASCPNLIKQGQVSGCVTELQNLLRGRGHGLTVDGNFGPRTLAAVKSFQSSAGLAADGIVGPKTKSALYAGQGGGGVPAPVNLNSPSCPNLIKQGQVSGCVTELQNLLNHHGAGIGVDGNFGPRTLSAVKGFQSARGLAADGIVGPKTKGALYGVVAPPPPPPPGGGHGNIVRVAAGEVGVIEGSARANSYGHSVGRSDSTSGYAWCATFVSWVMQQTGATGYRSAAVGGWVTQARNGQNGMSVVATPAPGDLIAFDWDGNGDYALPNRHIGIVEAVGGGGAITTLEGNTGPQGGGGPDGVYRKNRSSNAGYNVLFIRVR